MEGLILSFEGLGNAVETVLREPLDNFVEELGELSSLRKKMTKARDEYDTSRIKASKGQQKKPEKLQNNLESFEEIKLDYVHKLISMKLHKKFGVVKIINDWIRNLLFHYDGGNKLLARFEVRTSFYDYTFFFPNQKVLFHFKVGCFTWCFEW